MTELESDTSSPPHRRRRPDTGALVRHVVDAATPPFTFLFLHTPWGARRAALAALLAALLIGALCRHRGSPLGIVVASTVFVALHSASAIAMGDGRAFFLPEPAINAGMLAVCLGSLVINRPVTAIACRKLGLELGRAQCDSRTSRRHRRLTAGWAAMWFVHLVPLTYLYVINSVIGLTMLGTFVNKPTVLAMAAITVIVQRRAMARAATSATAA